MADVQAQVEAAVAEAARGDEWLCQHPPTLEWVSGVTGMEIAEDHPLYRTVSAAVTAVTGISPAVNPLHTSSDIRNPIVQKGIPTVGLGPRSGNLTQVGGSDEWVDVEDYFNMIKVTATVIVNWTGAAA
jgi:acetylornithine deacetylase